jgi:polar amino acid transport system permease protein
MDALAQNFFNPGVIDQVWRFLLDGLAYTLLLSAIVVPLGILAGMLLAVAGNLGARWLRWALVVYVDFFRAFPPLVLLIFIYFGAPFAGLDLPRLGAVAIAFTLTTSSYYGEVFRAGIESVSSRQVEAGRSTGLTRLQVMQSIVLPQAIRNMRPDLISNTLEVIKMTSLASVVAVPELLGNARQAQALTYNPTPIVIAACIYLVLLLPIVRLLTLLERRRSMPRTV